MRNVIVQTLPPGATLIVEVAPPMTDEERPMLLSFERSVVVQVIDTSHLEITNTTNKTAPFIVLVGKPIQVPPELQGTMAMLLAALRKR